MCDLQSRLGAAQIPYTVYRARVQASRRLHHLLCKRMQMPVLNCINYIH
jgi:hypothetical protein